MIVGNLVVAAAMLVAGQAQSGSTAAPVGPGPSVNEISKDQAKALVSECGSRRFETSVEAPVDGKLRRIRLRLCAADSETTAQWIAKLEKSAGQIDGQATLAASAKAKLLGDLRAEIARVKSAESQPLALGQSFNLSRPITVVGTPSPVGPVSGRPPLRAPRSPLADIHAMPPLPRGPVAGQAPAPSARAALGPRPKLAVECATAGDDRTGRCGLITANERLVVRATERFTGPIALRFVRTGTSISAEVPLATNGLGAGQSGRFKVPREICAGRVRAKFEIEVLASGAQSGERLGPFETRCAS